MRSETYAPESLHRRIGFRFASACRQLRGVRTQAQAADIVGMQLPIYDDSLDWAIKQVILRLADMLGDLHP